MNPDDSKKLARALLEGLDGEAIETAADVEKAARDRLQLIELYVRTGQKRLVDVIADACIRLAPRTHDAAAVEWVTTALEIVIAPLPSDDTRRFVAARVHTESGETASTEWLARGTPDALAAFLRDGDTPAAIERVANRLGLTQLRFELP